MSDKVMKIAGKTSDSLVKGVRVTTDGNIEDVRKWHYEYTKILNLAEIRDATAIVVDGGSVEDYGMLSFRIYNTLDHPVKIWFYNDDSPNGGSTTLRDMNGDFKLIIPASTSGLIITSNDVPFLNYLRYIKLRVQAASAPSSGKLTIVLCKKG